jgi:serine phosphatase RsbU (regulator of sigma subunit)
VLNNLNQVLLGAVSGAGPGQKTAASFATCLCARVYANGKMTVANAGHLNPYRDGREMELAADLPLGVIGNIRYEQAAFQLKIGERLIFLSDGVVEATNAQGDLFGFERARQLANEPVRTIAETAKRFGQTDDITVVCLCFASHAVDGTGQQEALEGASLDRKP